MLRAPAYSEQEHAMLTPLDALDSCSRELVDFQVRAGKLQADTDNLIAGTEAALADSREMMRRVDGDLPMPPATAPRPVRRRFARHRAFRFG